MEDRTVRQLEMYQDDSITVTYNDGCKLLLSACSASFLHMDMNSRGQSCPSSCPNRLHQITQFAVSEYRQKLNHALEFRNKFAERLFLCDLNGDKPKQIRDVAVKVITWPICAHCIEYTNSGSQLLHSKDRNACIELMPNGRLFTVTYWAASNKRDTCSGVTHYPVVRWCSVSDVPDMWVCPLKLLVTNGQRNCIECSHVDEHDCSVLHDPLPIMCRNVHLHHWDKSSLHQPGLSDMLRIVWSDNVTYRLMWDKQCVEAYADQHTVIRSCDLQGRYYNMWTSHNGEPNQFKINIDHLPQWKEFSLAAVTGRMSRLLKAMAAWRGEMLIQSICWMVNNEDIPTMPRGQCLVKEEANLTGIGRFVAYRSGRIYIAHVDHTVLEMQWPQDDQQNRMLLLESCQHLPAGYCRLLLSSGQYHMIPTAHAPQPYQRYIQGAVEWGRWAYCEQHQRSDTFTISSSDTQHNRVASDEVAKIRELLCNILV